MLHSPLHAAGYALDPEYHAHTGGHNNEVKEVLDTMLRRLTSNPDAQGQARLQYGRYQRKADAFSPEGNPGWAPNLLRETPAWEWLHVLGSGAPQLQRVAMQVLAQPSSSSACERKWSSYSFVYNDLRNRLTPKRAEGLVFLFGTLKLLRAEHRRIATGKGEDAIPWSWRPDSEDEADDAEEGEEGWAEALLQLMQMVRWI